MKINHFVLGIVVLASISMIFMAGCGTNPTGGGGGGGGGGTHGPAYANIIWVSTTGSDDAGTGTSEATAYQHIAKALSVAPAKTLIKVEDGIYKEHLTWSTFEVVCISGESRDGTIISGEGTGGCIYIDGSAATNQTITMESLTINNGYITSRDGAGIDIHRTDVNLHLKNVVMTNNNVGASRDGGAINGGYYSNNVLAENCTFESNTAYDGGAIFLTWNGNALGGGLIARNCTFSNNSALYYGAINASYVTIESCSFSGNSSVNPTGPAEGGAMIVMCGGSIVNCLFFNNLVDATGGSGYGGALRHYNSGPADSQAPLKIVNCTLVSNEVKASGGTSNDGAIFGYSNTIVTNCILWGNKATNNPQLDAGSVDHSDVQGGFTGATNRNIDPAFFGSIPYSAASDFVLTSSSSIEITQGGTTEGAPSTDFAGNPRTPPYSMGAFEKD